MSRSLTTQGGRIPGLDSLRCLCALWVALHHGARPDLAAWFGLSGVAEDWNAVAFDGVAAVMMFFVISGLCVHYPQARSGTLVLPAYATQRFLRVGIPLLAVAAFVKFGGGIVGDAIATAPRMVLWSLWCELIYYAIYPALRIGFRRIGLGWLIGAAFVAAYAVIFSHWGLMLYWSYPRTLCWVAALPAWLLGCAIAERLAEGRLPALPGSVWWWRAAALVLSIPPKALLYPSISPIAIGNPATLLPFSIFVFFWLMKEIATFTAKPPPAALEWGGRWSYSLYLTHNIVIAAFAASAWQPAGPGGGVVRWAVQLAAILAASYAFYCVVERPAHRLARTTGAWLARPRTVVQPVALPATVLDR